MKDNKQIPRLISSTFIYLLVFGGAIAIGGYLMIHEHRAHLPGGYFFLTILLLGCITMHLFMHGGGHGHSDDKGGK